jgi:hypothetical protein
MRSFRTGLHICILLLATSVRAQQAPSASAPTTQFLRQSLNALTGGVPIRDITLTGTVRRIAGSDDESGTAELKALSTGEALIEMSFPSGSRTEVRATSATGPVGQWTGPEGKLENVPQHNLFVDSAWFFPPLLVAKVISSQDSILTDIGPEMKNAHAVEHLSASRQIAASTPSLSALLQHLSQTEIYLDSSSLLPVVLSFNIHPDTNALRDVPVEIRFLDYRGVNGVHVPFHVQRYLNGVLALDVQFQTAAMNTGLTPDVFSVR